MGQAVDTLEDFSVVRLAGRVGVRRAGVDRERGGHGLGFAHDEGRFAEPTTAVEHEPGAGIAAGHVPARAFEEPGFELAHGVGRVIDPRLEQFAHPIAVAEGGDDVVVGWARRDALPAELALGHQSSTSKWVRARNSRKRASTSARVSDSSRLVPKPWTANEATVEP